MGAPESTGIDEGSTRLLSDIIPDLDRNAWREWNALLNGLMPSAPGDVWDRFASMTDAALLQLERIYAGTTLAGIVSGTSERRYLCGRGDKDPAAEAVSGSSTDNNAKAAMPIPRAVNTLRRLRVRLLKGVIQAGMHGELPGGRYLQDGQLAVLTPAHWQEVYGSYGAGAGSGGYPRLWDDLITLSDNSLHVFAADGTSTAVYRSIVFLPEPRGDLPEEPIAGEPARVTLPVLVAFLREIGPRSADEHLAAAQQCFRLVSRDNVRAARKQLQDEEKGQRGRPLG